MKTGHVLLWAFLAVHECVLLPVVCYWLFCTYQLRHSVTMRRRLENWLLFVGAFGLFYLAVTVPFSLTTATNQNWRDAKKTRVINILLVLPSLMAAWPELARQWLLYYGLKLSRATAKKQWIALLNNGREDVAKNGLNTSTLSEYNEGGDVSSHLEAALKETKDSSVNWYIAHIDSYGNRHWCLSCATICCTVHVFVVYSMFAAAFLGVVSWRIPQAMNLLVLVSLRLFTIVLYCKTPAVNDHILFREELGYIAWTQGSVLFGFCVALVFWTLFEVSYATAALIATVILDAMFVALFGFVFHVIPQKLQQRNLLGQSLDHNFGSDPSVSKSWVRSMPKLALALSNTSSASRRRRRPKADDTLIRLIADNDGFQLFMAHLMQEFSAECLLSVVELVRFKQLVGGQLEDGACFELQCDTTDTGKCPSRVHCLQVAEFRLPRCARRCGIVPKRLSTETDAVATTLRVCDALFAKYISEDASLQINVSYATRSRVRTTFEGLRLVDGDSSEWMHRAAHLWDDCVDEMFALLSHSCARFVKTNEFEVWSNQCFWRFPEKVPSVG